MPKQRFLATAVALLFSAGPALAVEINVAKEPAEKSVAAYANPKWKAPRTSWGDPDLSGTFSTDDMRSVPRSGPTNGHSR